MSDLKITIPVTVYSSIPDETYLRALLQDAASDAVDLINTRLRNVAAMADSATVEDQ